MCNREFWLTQFDYTKKKKSKNTTKYHNIFTIPSFLGSK